MIRSTLHLELFSLSPISAELELKLFKSFCIAVASSLLATSLKSLVSSAKVATDELVTEELRSLPYIRNSTGPSMES